MKKVFRLGSESTVGAMSCTIRQNLWRLQRCTGPRKWMSVLPYEVSNYLFPFSASNSTTREQSSISIVLWRTKSLLLLFMSEAYFVTVFWVVSIDLWCFKMGSSWVSNMFSKQCFVECDWERFPASEGELYSWPSCCCSVRQVVIQ